VTTQLQFIIIIIIIIIIIKMYVRKIGHGLNSTGSKEGLVEGSTEPSNELPGLKKCWELDWM